MKQSSILPGLALAALSLLAAATPTHAGERPIRASGAGTINSGTMYARLEATHLGKANFVGGVDPDLFDNSQILEIPVSLTAANGDRLFLDAVVFFDVDTEIAVGTVTFSGGTGRFETATGSADVMFDFGDYPHQHFLVLIDGSIDY